MKTRKKYTAKEKFQVVLELLKGEKTQAEITSEYGVHSSQQVKRKKQFLEDGEDIFEDKRTAKSKEKRHAKQTDVLLRQIGQLSVERDWLQKKIGRQTKLQC